MKKIFAVILTLALAVTAFCVPVSAASYKVTVSKYYEDGYTIVTLKPSSGTVYYTTDGTKANKSDKKYKAWTKLKFTKPTTLRMTVYSGGKAVKTYTEKITVKLKEPTIKFTAKADGKFSAKITAEKGATIYYTINGLKPTTNSRKLSGNKITVAPCTTVRAIAVKKGWKDSSPVTEVAPKEAPKEDSSSDVTETPSVPDEEITDSEEEPTIEEELLLLVNAERVKNGLSELAADDILNNIAKQRVEDISVRYDTNGAKEGTCFTVLMQHGVVLRTCAESRERRYASPEEVFKAFMNSTEHKSNILNSGFTKVGIGYCKADDVYGDYWVMLFIGE